MEGPLGNQYTVAVREDRLCSLDRVDSCFAMSSRTRLFGDLDVVSASLLWAYRATSPYYSTKPFTYNFPLNSILLSAALTVFLRQGYSSQITWTTYLSPQLPNLAAYNWL
jgi:hypothetical protein